MLRMLSIVALLCLAGLASAADTPMVKDIPEYLARQEVLRKDLMSSKKYGHMDRHSRQQILGAQDELQRLLRGRQSVDELNVEQRVAVFNAENLIASTLQNAADDRPICENVKTVGSNLSRVQCVSKRQRDANRRDLQTQLMAPRACASERCGGD